MPRMMIDEREALKETPEKATRLEEQLEHVRDQHNSSPTRLRRAFGPWEVERHILVADVSVTWLTSMNCAPKPLNSTSVTCRFRPRQAQSSGRSSEDWVLS